MSVVHQGMPEIAMLRPARTCWRSDSHVAGMSPDHTAAPNRWDPAQADRDRKTVCSFRAAAIPSANSLALSRG